MSTRRGAGTHVPPLSSRGHQGQHYSPRHSDRTRGRGRHRHHHHHDDHYHYHSQQSDSAGPSGLRRRSGADLFAATVAAAVAASHSNSVSSAGGAPGGGGSGTGPSAGSGGGGGGSAPTSPGPLTRAALEHSSMTHQRSRFAPDRSGGGSAIPGPSLSAGATFFGHPLGSGGSVGAAVSPPAAMDSNGFMPTAHVTTNTTHSTVAAAAAAAMTAGSAAGSSAYGSRRSGMGAAPIAGEDGLGLAANDIFASSAATAGADSTLLGSGHVGSVGAAVATANGDSGTVAAAGGAAAAIAAARGLAKVESLRAGMGRASAGPAGGGGSNGGADSPRALEGPEADIPASRRFLQTVESLKEAGVPPTLTAAGSRRAREVLRRSHGRSGKAGAHRGERSMGRNTSGVSVDLGAAAARAVAAVDAEREREREREARRAAGGEPTVSG